MYQTVTRPEAVFSQNISGTPSKLKSAAPATCHPGSPPSLIQFALSSVAPPLPPMYQTMTWLVVVFSHTISGTPSPLKSAAAATCHPGSPPSLIQLVLCSVVPPLPPMYHTMTWLVVVFSHTISGTPSPLKSAIAATRHPGSPPSLIQSQLCIAAPPLPPIYQTVTSPVLLFCQTKSG